MNRRQKPLVLSEQEKHLLQRAIFKWPKARRSKPRDQEHLIARIRAVDEKQAWRAANPTAKCETCVNKREEQGMMRARCVLGDESNGWYTPIKNMADWCMRWEQNEYR